MTHHVTAADTSVDARRLQVAHWKAMTPWQRAQLADRLSIDVSRLAIAGIRARHPEYTDQEVHHELTRRRYGDDIARLLTDCHHSR